MSDITDYESLYDPETNQYIPGSVAEDYEEHGDRLTYKADVLLETPIDQTLKALINETLKK